MFQTSICSFWLAEKNGVALSDRLVRRKKVLTSDSAHDLCETALSGPQNVLCGEKRSPPKTDVGNITCYKLLQPLVSKQAYYVMLSHIYYVYEKLCVCVAVMSNCQTRSIMYKTNDNPTLTKETTSFSIRYTRGWLGCSFRPRQVPGRPPIVSWPSATR